MRIILWILALVAVCGGAGIVFTSLPDAAWGAVDPSPLGGGVALSAVGLTSGIALITSASFSQQRKQAAEALLREQRARVYEGLLAGMIGSFMGKPAAVEMERAQVALWASPATVDAFESWFTFASRNTGVLDEKQRLKAYGHVARCIRHVRIELGIDTERSPLASDSALQMIFVNFRDERDAASEVLSARP